MDVRLKQKNQIIHISYHHIKAYAHITQFRVHFCPSPSHRQSTQSPRPCAPVHYYDTFIHESRKAPRHIHIYINWAKCVLGVVAPLTRSFSWCPSFERGGRVHFALLASTLVGLIAIHYRAVMAGCSSR